MKRILMTYEEIMASRGDGARGLKCPKCGCVQFSRVRNTVPVEGEIRRYRKCRNCGYEWTTYEA